MKTTSPKSKLPWKAAPKVYKKIFENKHVRILEVHLKPRASTPLHTHLKRLVYAVHGTRIAATTDKGKKQSFTFKDHTWYRLPPMTHAPKNVDTKEAHYLSIEFKK